MRLYTLITTPECVLYQQIAGTVSLQQIVHQILRAIIILDACLIVLRDHSHIQILKCAKLSVLLLTSPTKELMHAF